MLSFKGDNDQVADMCYTVTCQCDCRCQGHYLRLFPNLDVLADDKIRLGKPITMKRLVSDEQEHAKKRAKTAPMSYSQNAQKFTNAEAIRTVLHAQNSDVLTQGMILSSSRVD